MSSHPSQRQRWALAVSFLMMLAGGCQQPAAPRPVDGVFVLRTVGTNPIPALTDVVLSTEFWVLADTIALGADGSGEWRSTTARRNLNTDARDTTRTVKRFDHRRRGAAVSATGITCEPLCDALPDFAEFYLDGDWLTLGFGPSAQRYERIAPSAAR